MGVFSDFVRAHPPPDRKVDLDAYFEIFSAYLLKESGLENAVPVDLEALADHFGLQVNYVELPKEMSGNALPTHSAILVNQDHLLARQRFTIAHELMEYFISSLVGQCTGSAAEALADHKSKELLCDSGASKILLPKAHINDLAQSDLTEDHVLALTEKFMASPEAILRRCMDCCDRRAVMVHWEDGGKGVRVKSFKQSRPGHPIPIRYNKSVGEKSLIYQVHQDGTSREGKEFIVLKEDKGFEGQVFAYRLGEEPWTKTWSVVYL